MYFKKNNAVEYAIVPIIAAGESEEETKAATTEEEKDEEKLDIVEEVKEKDTKLKVTIRGAEYVLTDYSEDKEEEIEIKYPFTFMNEKRIRSGYTIYPKRFSDYKYQSICMSEATSKNKFNILYENDKDNENEVYYISNITKEVTCIRVELRGGFKQW